MKKAESRMSGNDNWKTQLGRKKKQLNEENQHYRFVLDDVLNNGHSTVILLHKAQSEGLAHATLAVNRWWTGFS